MKNDIAVKILQNPTEKFHHPGKFSNSCEMAEAGSLITIEVSAARAETVL